MSDMPSEENKSKEQKVAEAEVESFRKDLGPFVVAAETTRMAMVFTDAKEANHPLIFANDSFLSLAGYDRHFASFVDLSKHKQEQDHLRFLLGERNHRTQNTLATVQAIAKPPIHDHHFGSSKPAEQNQDQHDNEYEGEPAP
jgi:two-component sensor histidine kinase